MKKTAEEVVKELDLTMNDIRNRMFEEDVIEDIDPEDFKLLMRSLRLVELSKKLCIEQAEAFDTINEKLDKLLSK